MRTTSAFMGTPGTVSAFLAVDGKHRLVVIDRRLDTWERTGEFKAGEARWAVQLEPSHEFAMYASQREAREEAGRLSDLTTRALRDETRPWLVGE